MKLGNLIKKAATLVKQNPEVALAVAGIVAPKLARKAVPIIVAVAMKKAD